MHIYLDHHATTPTDSRVLEAMLPFFAQDFGNAASTDHPAGLKASQTVEAARGQVAKLIGAKPAEIVFTSGATESNNLAIIGAAEALQDKGRHIVTSVIEHPAVLDTCRHLEGRGWEVTYLPVDPFGLHSAAQVEAAIRPDTVLVSLMAANNEIGVLQPIEEIGAVTRQRGVLLHTDATQAMCFIPIDVNAQGIDLLSLSGHKMYGPKGIGALYVRRRAPRVRLEAQIHGGGHERGMRSGTLNVPGIVGLGEAAKIALAQRRSDAERIRRLRDLLWSQLVCLVEGLEVNGHASRRLPNNLNFTAAGAEARSVIVDVGDQIAISTGSACSTASVKPSHVISALGGGDQRAHESIRIGLGRGTTETEIASAVDLLAGSIGKARSYAALG